MRKADQMNELPLTTCAVDPTCDTQPSLYAGSINNKWQRNACAAQPPGTARTVSASSFLPSFARTEFKKGLPPCVSWPRTSASRRILCLAAAHQDALTRCLQHLMLGGLRALIADKSESCMRFGQTPSVRSKSYADYRNAPNFPFIEG